MSKSYNNIIDITCGNVSNEQKEKTRKQLEEYCCLDTKGMVWIVEKLKELTAKTILLPFLPIFDIMGFVVAVEFFVCNGRSVIAYA